MAPPIQFILDAQEAKARERAEAVGANFSPARLAAVD